LSKNKKEHYFLEKISADINVWEKENLNTKQYWKVYLINAPEIFKFLLQLSSFNCLTKKEKILLASVIAYFINPLDFLPELFLGALGYLDDVVAGAMFLQQILPKLSGEYIGLNWKSRIKLLPFIDSVLINADHIVDNLVYRKLKKQFSSIQ